MSSRAPPQPRNLGGVGAHVIYEPEWVIETSGRGSFRIECECGWERSGFDTVSSARSAAFDHSAKGAELMPDRAQQPSPPPAAERRRFWRR